MALVRFGNGISELRGSIAGTTFSRNHAGAIARNRISPVNPNTPFQDTQRSYLSSAVNALKNLTAAKVAEWDSFAQTLTRFNAFGDPYTPTGAQIFLESALNQYRIGNSPLGAAPLGTPEEPSVNTISANIVATVVAGVLTKYEIAGVAANDATDWTIWITPPLSPSVNNPARYFKAIANYSGGDPNADHLAAAETRLGVASIPAVAGQKVFARVRAINDANGFQSAMYDIAGVVTV